MFETMVMHLNSGGAWFCGWAWAMLWQSSIVIAALLVLDTVLKNRVRATVRYALWTLVLVKLVLPPSLCVPTGAGYWCNIEPTFQSKQAAEDKTAEASWRNEPSLAFVPTASAAATIASETTAVADVPVAQAVETSEPTMAMTWQGAIFLLWAAGVLVLVVLLAQRMFFVRGLVLQSKPAEGRLRETMERCKLQAGVRENIELRLTENMLSPAACGLARPVVLMPRTMLESLSRERVRAVLIHELMHIRRKDLWVNMAQSLVQIAYFYNPLVWVANARIRAVREQAVDEAALANLGNEAGEYGRTLVAVAEVAFSMPHFSLGLVGVVESKKSLATRIRHIARMGIPKSAKIGLAGIVAVVLVGLVLVPMASAKTGAAEFVMKGKVTDAATGKPIAGARVGDDRYAGGKQWTTSDANGNYSYLTWYEEHGVSAEADGYKKQNKGFGTKVFGREKEKVLNFALQPGAGDINLATVTVQEGVGFDGFVVGDDGCTGESIKSKLGKPDEEVRDEKGWWLNYRKSHCIDFWIYLRTNTLHEIRLNPGFKGKLASGISMSSDMKDVFNTYGKPVREEASDYLSKSGFDDRVLYRGPVSDLDQALYRLGISANSGVSKIYYKQKGLLIWFKGEEIHQLVLFSAKQKAEAPQFLIRGRVTDVATGKPIASVRVGDDGYAGGKQWTTSDANGNYSYLTWYEEHNISCSAPGYGTKKDILLTKVIGSEKERVLNFGLAQDGEATSQPIAETHMVEAIDQGAGSHQTGGTSGVTSSTNAWQNAAEEQFTKRFRVSPGGTVVVNVDFGSIAVISRPVDPETKVVQSADNGSIAVSGSDFNEVTVDVWRKVGRKSVEEAQAFLKEHPVSFTQDGSVVTVEAKHEKDNSWFKGIRNRNEAKYVISVPAKFNAKLGTSGGSITVSDLTGAVTAETSGGGLKFAHIQGALNGETSGGSISVTDCAGAIKVETSGGGIGVTGGSGTLTGGTSGGSVKVKNFQGNTHIETSGSGITIENVVGEIHGETSGGGISAVLSAGLVGPVHLETSGGSITLRVPENSAFELDAETSGGGVKCDLPVTTTGKKERGHLKGTVNGGGKSVKLETSGGSIQVKKL